MREVSGTTWTFQLIILFILIFACFLTLVLNYSKAYTVKNEMLTMIEKYEGVTSDSLEIINGYLHEKGYKTLGTCADGWIGATNLEGSVEDAQKGKSYYYCFKEESAKNEIYYNVRLFYRFNLPFLGELATFEVNGRTNSFIGSDNRI